MSDSTPFRLTATVKAGGCASKLSPAILDQVLSKLPQQTDPNVLVGFDHADDAGIYQITPDIALVQTVDFFTPMVDDPYTFGQIAATNALSDVYAMGGRPISALAHVCFPPNGDVAILERTLGGGLSKMMEAGCAVIGGHSVRDEEMKFGYSVTGLIDPKKVLAKIFHHPGVPNQVALKNGGGWKCFEEIRLQRCAQIVAIAESLHEVALLLCAVCRTGAIRLRLSDVLPHHDTFRESASIFSGEALAMNNVAGTVGRTVFHSEPVSPGPVVLHREPLRQVLSGHRRREHRGRESQFGIDKHCSDSSCVQSVMSLHLRHSIGDQRQPIPIKGRRRPTNRASQSSTVQLTITS